ncbi:MAG: response regulator transcription factor [Candidatus Caldatribacterium sp.]|nr:response regulator transcription factor [Candidatus Caldatribacterium sp.]
MQSDEKENLRIAIVDDHLLFAEGLKALIEEEKLGTCTVYENGEEALRAIPLGSFDIAFVDLRLPDTSGFEVIKVLRQKVPELHILVLTVDDSRESFLKALSLGAQGYILKNAPFARIVNDIRAALRGDLVIGAEMALYLAQGVQVPKPRGKTEQTLEALTKREREVLRLLTQGKDNGTTAQELHLSEKTVKNYVSSILNKLGFEDRVKLVIFAIEEGLFREEEPGKKEEKP